MDIEPGKAYRRYEDMSPDGFISLVLQEDGDVCLLVQQGNLRNRDDFHIASVEFCLPGSGGGQSRHTRQALQDLIVAIQKDNEEFEQFRDRRSR